jgi:hypothetical protein
MRREDLQPNAAVRGVLPDQFVTVVGVQWFGSQALELTYKGASGRLANELLYRHDEPRLEVVERGRPWSFDGDGRLFRLVSEAHRSQSAKPGSNKSPFDSRLPHGTDTDYDKIDRGAFTVHTLRGRPNPPALHLRHRPQAERPGPTILLRIARL